MSKDAGKLEPQARSSKFPVKEDKQMSNWCHTMVVWANIQQTVHKINLPGISSNDLEFEVKKDKS